jgi:sugar O-acyltransferase (sialic acid O-acetyltransferase NeuD family)
MLTKRNPFHKASPDFARVYIFGAGGFAREVAWLIEQCWGREVESVFLVDREEYLSGPVNGVPVKLVSEVTASRDDRFVVAVGSSDIRRKAVHECTNANLRPEVFVHPRVEASTHVTLGDGSIVCAGSILTTNIEVGRHVHINLDCTIGHDVVIGDYSTLSPGVHVSGNVTVGKGVFIGTGAVIINGQSNDVLSIGDGAVIAAGACVTKSVDTGALVAGVPAIRKR